MDNCHQGGRGGAYSSKIERFSGEFVVNVHIMHELHNRASMTYKLKDIG